MATKADKLADRRIDRAYRKNCEGIQIDVFDISKVFAVGRAAIAAGDDDVALAAKIVAFVATIRKN